MTDNARSTYEEAKCCPKCGRPGEVTKITPGPKGSKVHHIQCKTELCRWFNTFFLVQVNADGSIPPPQDHTHSPKVYEGFEKHDDLAKQIIEGLKAQQARETQGGAEIRNPFSTR